MSHDGMSLVDWELKLAEVNVAISRVLENRSYTMDEVTYTRESLGTLLEFQKECRREIAAKKSEDGKKPGPKVFNVCLAE